MTKVILINGPARSGKDTLADAVQSSRFNQPRSSELHFQHVTFKYKFANIMQSLWRGIFHTITDKDFEEWVDGSKKNEVHPFLGRSFRQAMISFSEDYIKPHYGNDFFGRLTAEEIKLDADDFNSVELVALISDSGFKEEAVAVIQKFGAENVMLVKIYRAGFTFEGDSRTYIDLDEFGVETVELDNITVDQFVRDGTRLIREFVER